MGDLLKFSIPGKPEYFKMLRISIASLASNAGFNVEAIDDIKVSVGEACKYVTCHGYEGCSNRYEVICEMTDDKIIIRVEDGGEGHNIVKNIKPCSNCPSEGDLGVFIIETLMDEVEFQENSDGSKYVRMVKNK